MYFMMTCLSPQQGYLAQLEYEPDDPLRDWMVGERFDEAPQEPIQATRVPRENTVLAEFWQVPIPLMSKRLQTACLGAGVSNIDIYQAEIIDSVSGQINADYVAFNIIGTIAAADMEKSKFSVPNSPLISVDFDSLVIDENRTRGALMFRLAESVNGIVVHESVKNAIEAAGIDTLTFIPPEEWVG